jgi:hypothetical protein
MHKGQKQDIPVRLRRMQIHQFQAQMERRMKFDGKMGLTRILTCSSTLCIPNTIFSEVLRKKFDSLSPENQSKTSFKKYTKDQEDSIGRRGLFGQGQEDFFNQRAFHCPTDGVVSILCDPYHDQYDTAQNFGGLFLIGGVAAVHLRGHKEGNVVVPYDGNDHGILNMGLVKGFKDSGATVLFGWEVITEFYQAVATSDTNFNRHFQLKLKMWCDGVRQHPGRTALALSIDFIMLAIDLAWHILTISASLSHSIFAKDSGSHYSPYYLLETLPSFL